MVVIRSSSRRTRRHITRRSVHAPWQPYYAQRAAEKGEMSWHLFGLAEMDLAFGGSANQALRHALLGLILQTRETSIRDQLPQTWNTTVRTDAGKSLATPVPVHYGAAFAALVSRRWFADYGVSAGRSPDAIITFNYDCFLDDALLKIGVRPEYELPLDAIPEAWSAHPTSVTLLKLHGSTNWFRCTSSICANIWVAESTWRRNYLYGCIQCPYCSQPSVEPVIVPPAWTKGEYRETLTSIWSKALEVLRKADQLFIIGYSVPPADAFFQYLLSLALAENPDIKQIHIVNRNVQTLKNFEILFQEPFRGRHVTTYPRFQGLTTAVFVLDHLSAALRQGNPPGAAQKNSPTPSDSAAVPNDEAGGLNFTRSSRHIYLAATSAPATSGILVSSAGTPSAPAGSAVRVR
jgi:NAD-dependent SIR2 family protein deacetylase